MQGKHGHLSREQKPLALARLHAKGWRMVDIAKGIGCSAPMVGIMARAGRHLGANPTAVADLEHEGVSSDEGEPTGLVQSAGAELLDVIVQVFGHLVDLRLRQRGDAQRVYELVHTMRAHLE